uniref:NP n=1 Tax=Longchuan virus TaxID=2594109 RepID=A0A514YA80_9ORTO|nr:NP [Longchuan virus]
MSKPDGKIVSENKRARVGDVTEEGKAKALEYILKMAVSVSQFLVMPDILDEIIGSTQIMTIVYRIHQYMRKKKNNQRTIAPSIAKIESNEQIFVVRGQTKLLKAADMAKIFDVAVERVFGKDASIDLIFGTTHTIVCHMALFASRLNELRIGPDVWIQQKTEGMIKQNKLTQFGIEPRYRHFMSGISWDMGVRSTLSRSTSGPCQLALLSKGESGTYSNRAEAAVQNAFSYIPMISTITTFVKNNQPQTNREIIKTMVDITRLHGDSHKRRMSPPLCFLFKHCYKTDGTITNTADIGFSSKKGAVLYNKYYGSLSIPAGIDKEKFKQLFFHAYFGTHGEDQGVLASITNNSSWLKRGDFDREFFVKMKEHTQVTNTTGIKLKYYAKSVSASQNRMLAHGNEITGCVETMSGFRVRHIEDNVLDLNGPQGYSSYSSVTNTSSSILEYLNEIRTDLIKKIKTVKKEGGEITAGTVKWRKIETATFEKGIDGEESDIMAYEKGECFWSN